MFSKHKPNIISIWNISLFLQHPLFTSIQPPFTPSIRHGRIRMFKIKSSNYDWIVWLDCEHSISLFLHPYKPRNAMLCYARLKKTDWDVAPWIMELVMSWFSSLPQFWHDIRSKPRDYSCITNQPPKDTIRFQWSQYNSLMIPIGGAQHVSKWLC